MKNVALIIAALACVVNIGIAQGQRRGRDQSSENAKRGSLEQRLDQLALQISEGLTENRKRTIAVVEFSDLKNNATNFGRFLSEELTTRLYKTKKFKVIERQQLNKIIAEQKLSLTGLVEPASAQKLGRVLGVDSIVFRFDL
jgi:curli biogenesis system outer membrane secretion channel CsgG